MSYFNLELIKKIKSINAVTLSTIEIAGIFKDRENSIDGKIITWFNGSIGQYENLLHYLEFDNSTPDELIYGTYTEGMFGVKTKIQIGSFALNENFNFFSITAPNNLLHIVFENDVYLPIKCTATESESPEIFLNKIFTFDYTNENGTVSYSTKTGDELILIFSHSVHKWIMVYNDTESQIEGIETNDNSLYDLVYSNTTNAFNDYFQFIPFVFISSSSGSGKGKR